MSVGQVDVAFATKPYIQGLVGGVMEAVSQLLDAVEGGDPQAAERLLPLVYDELRRLAAAQLAWETPGHSLDATALVHEAYLRLVGDRQYNDRAHFFRVAAEAMRHILVDRARKRMTAKHGGEFQRIPISAIEAASDATPEEVLALDVALEKLSAADPEKADLVKLRFYAGMSEAEAAAALGISRATASRHWNYARAWLLDAMEKS